MTSKLEVRSVQRDDFNHWRPLWDGYNAFYGRSGPTALPDSITDGDGRPVHALLGSVNQLLWCVDKYDPRAVVCCFGQESATYRTELYPPYHAHRPEMPDPLADQWQRAPALY